MTDNRKVSLIEYEAARKFVDRIHDLCDHHDRNQREDYTDGPVAHP